MKNLKYSEVTHSPRYDYSDAGVPKYATDWNRNEERFKVTGNGAIRVYQGGRVEIILTELARSIGKERSAYVR